MDHRFNSTLSYTETVKKQIVLLVSICIIATLAIFSVQSSAASPDDTSTTSSVQDTTTLETTTTTVVETSTTPVPTTTILTLNPEQIRYLDMIQVNRRKYSWGVPGPAMETFRTVAKYRGWSAAQIQSWETAVYDIMKGESGFCPNTLGGARLANNDGCIIARQGRRSDAGFGQVISIHYRITYPGTGWLCRQEHICNKWDIVNSPWNSMTALLALIERSGTYGWCYSRRARAHHHVTCSNPGLDV